MFMKTKMLTFVFLLTVLSIPKVWSRPTTENGELTSTAKEEELRYKRQAKFFDLLHQAIEKYANCADEHLSPLKSLAAHKQYEALIPDKYSPTIKPIVGASPSNSKKPTVKCTRVNLCTIISQNSFSETADDNNSAILGKVSDTKLNNTNVLPYFATNESDNTKHQSHAVKPHGSGNVLMKFGARHSNYNNNLRNQGLLNLFFNKPTIVSRKKKLKAAESETVVGSTLTKTATSMESSSCACLEGDRREIIINKTTTDYQLQSSNQQEDEQDFNGCPCLEIGSGSDEALGSVADRNVLSGESKDFDRNLNQLLMQLDEMAERASNKELRDIVEKLKNLRSAFDTNFESKEDYPRATTPVSFKVGVQVGQQTPKVSSNIPHQFSFSKLGLGLLNTLFKPKSVTQVNKGTDYATGLSKDSPNRGNVLESKANERHVEYVTSSYDSQSLGEGIKKSFLETHVLEEPSELSNENFREVVTESCLQEKKLHNSAYKSYNLAKQHDFVGITHRPGLEESHEDYYAYSNQHKTHHDSERVAQAPAVSRQNIKTRNPIAEYQTNSSKHDKKDSKITISITSNGNFKHIHVEQHIPDEKRLEISEKEKMNMATSSYGRQYKDMVGTGSKLVEVVKQPQKIDSYAEPILSEAYSVKAKRTTTSPFSVYWHKIEKLPSESKTATKGVWQTFESSDVLDCGNCNEQNRAANSKRALDTPHSKRQKPEFA